MTRVVLHVGAPKSGTTFLQRALWALRDELLEQGVTCPGEGGRDMFLASIEVREVFERWGFAREELSGTWSRLCAEARAYDGTTVMSHELLAAASQEQVRAALAELEGLEVHLVLTERDLGRQVMSEWQERVKNGGTQSFQGFSRSVLRQAGDADPTSLFWRYHGVPHVLGRWGAELPPERVHLVVAPRSAADPLELWRRFGQAVGIDTAQAVPPSSAGTANQTLGTAEVALLRGVNEALAGRIKQPHYARIVKRQFAQGLLAEHRSPRPVAPPDLVSDLRTVAEEWCQEVARRGYRVYGDLDELLPAPSAEDAPAPDDVDPRELAQLSTTLIADLLVARAESRSRPAPTGEKVLDRGPEHPRLRARVRAGAGRVRAAVTRRTWRRGDAVRPG